jgi:hypothetical protein
VPLVYFGSSALVKLVGEEQGSDLAADLWDGCDAALSSGLAYPEVCAALAASGRDHDFDKDGELMAEQAWEEYWAATRPELQAGIMCTWTENSFGQAGNPCRLFSSGSLDELGALRAPTIRSVQSNKAG